MIRLIFVLICLLIPQFVYSGVTCTSLIPNNPGFELAIGSSEGANWWPTTGASRVSNTESMTGSYIGKIYAISEWVETGHCSDPTYEDPITCDAQGEYWYDDSFWFGVSSELRYRFLKEDFANTNGTITFDMRVKSGSSGKGSLGIVGYDSNNNVITKTTNVPAFVYQPGHRFSLYGIFSEPVNTSLFISTTPATDTTYTKSLNIGRYINLSLNTGKTWNDITKVILSIKGEAENGDFVEFYIDNFR